MSEFIDDTGQALAFGVFDPGDGCGARPGARFAGMAVDLKALTAVSRDLDDYAPVFAAPSLETFMALGDDAWRTFSAVLVGALTRREVEGVSHTLERVEMSLPFGIRDFVDFYASRHHAQSAGQLLRPGSELPECWPYIPIGYDSRGSSVSADARELARPFGQVKSATDGSVVFWQTQNLDPELELGFVIGTPSSGQPVDPDEAAEHVFGVVLLNDWRARDIQAFEARLLGPFLGKAFATTISGWVVPMFTLENLRVPLGDAGPSVPSQLVGKKAPTVLELDLEVGIQTSSMPEPDILAPTNARYLNWWSVEQQIAHLTSGGARLRTGDLLGAGTISDLLPQQAASMLELSKNGMNPVLLSDGTSRAFLEDGDQVFMGSPLLGSMSTTVVASIPSLASEARIGLGDGLAAKRLACVIQ